MRLMLRTELPPIEVQCITTQLPSPSFDQQALCQNALWWVGECENSLQRLESIVKIHRVFMYQAGFSQFMLDVATSHNYLVPVRTAPRCSKNLYVAVPGRNRTLFCCVFRLHYCIRSDLVWNFHKGQGSYVLDKLMNTYHVQDILIGMSMGEPSLIPRFSTIKNLVTRGSRTWVQGQSEPHTSELN